MQACRRGRLRLVTLFLAGGVPAGSNAGWAKKSESGIEFAQGLEAALLRAATENKPVAATAAARRPRFSTTSRFDNSPDFGFHLGFTQRF
jgi:hypothetical protein